MTPMSEVVTALVAVAGTAAGFVGYDLYRRVRSAIIEAHARERVFADLARALALHQTKATGRSFVVSAKTVRGIDGVNVEAVPTDDGRLKVRVVER